MLAGHTLADDLGVLVDENEWLGIRSVGETTLGSGGHHGGGTGEHGVLGEHGRSKQHLSFFLS